jgi:hypothetical protein
MVLMTARWDGICHGKPQRVDITEEQSVGKGHGRGVKVACLIPALELAIYSRRTLDSTTMFDQC